MIYQEYEIDRDSNVCVNGVCYVLYCELERTFVFWSVLLRTPQQEVGAHDWRQPLLGPFLAPQLITLVVSSL